MKQTLSFLLLIMLALVAAGAAASNADSTRRLGGYQAIQNVKDPYVEEIGKFAITEHNRKAKSNLAFVEVSSGEQQVVAGMNYRLVITARNGATDGSCRAVVYDKPWEKYRKLVSFHGQP